MNNLNNENIDVFYFQGNSYLSLEMFVWKCTGTFIIDNLPDKMDGKINVPRKYLFGKDKNHMISWCSDIRNIK